MMIRIIEQTIRGHSVYKIQYKWIGLIWRMFKYNKEIPWFKTIEGTNQYIDEVVAPKFSDQPNKSTKIVKVISI